MQWSRHPLPNENCRGLLNNDWNNGKTDPLKLRACLGLRGTKIKYDDTIKQNLVLISPMIVLNFSTIHSSPA
jgi:hypothetical protein